MLILDATGKFSILDTYVMIMMLVAFQFHINLPVSDKSKAIDGSVFDVFIYAAYGFITLITGTLVSLTLSHIITHLHRNLDKHPDENTGVTECFSFYFHGLAGYGLNLLNIATHREFSILGLGLSVPGAYENPKAPEIIFTQVIYFITVLAMPLAFLLVCGILWFIPMPRKAQMILYSIAEVLNAWSCIDVFVIAIVASLTEIEQFTKFIVGDIQKYFTRLLDGYNTCFQVKTYLEEGCWLFFCAAISFFISSFVILKVCRNALNERLPEHVKEYIKDKKRLRLSRVSNINSARTTISNETMNNELNSKKNLIEENE